MAAWSPATTIPGDGRRRGAVRAGLRADRDAALDRGGRGGRPGGLRDGLGDGDRRPDDRHGDRACRADGLRLDDDRSADARVNATPDAYKQFIPRRRCRPAARGRPGGRCPRAWASGEASRIMVGLFVAPAVVDAVAVLPALALGARRTRMLRTARRRSRYRRCGESDSPRRRRANDRWRGHGADPRALSRALRRSAGSPLGVRHDAIGRRRRAASASRRVGTRRSAGRRRSPRSRVPSRRRHGLDRRGRSVGRPGGRDHQAARAPPAHRRGHPRGQPAGEDRGHRRPRPHRDVRAGVRRPDGRTSEIDFVLGERLPADRARRRLGSADDAPPRASGFEPDHRARPRPPAVGARRRRSSTATSRSWTGSATRSTRSRTQVVDEGGPADARAAVRRSSASSSRSAARRRPVREIFNQLTNRDLALDRRRRDRLLPRRLRPPDPADRRARQLPRAGQRRPSTSTSRRSTTTCR